MRAFILRITHRLLKTIQQLYFGGRSPLEELVKSALRNFLIYFIVQWSIKKIFSIVEVSNYIF